jgi:hypothetical protein
MTYPRGIAAQARIINDWRARVEAVGEPAKPAVQSLFVDLTKDPQAPPQPIHFKSAETRTQDGLDARFAANTLASYLLTQRLLPLIGASGRVRRHSSEVTADDLRSHKGCT